MTTMLEQAIVEAAELREAALRSAEAAIVEKYTDEVKSQEFFKYVLQNVLKLPK